MNGTPQYAAGDVPATTNAKASSATQADSIATALDRLRRELHAVSKLSPDGRFSLDELHTIRKTLGEIGAQLDSAAAQVRTGFAADAQQIEKQTAAG